MSESKEIEAYAKTIHSLERKLAAVTAERDRLRRDKARLDSGRMKVAIANPNGIGGTVGILELDLRAAIDAATEGGAK